MDAPKAFSDAELTIRERQLDFEQTIVRSLSNSREEQERIDRERRYLATIRELSCCGCCCAIG